MKKITFALILLVLGTLTTDVFAQKISKGDTPVTSRINDSNPNNIDPLTGLPKNYRIKSDSRGDYKQGVDSVSSFIQGIGDWLLDTKTSAVRKVFVDFRDPVLNASLNGNQTANAPFQTATVPVRFISKCSQELIKMQDIGLGQTKLCPLAISIDYAGQTYAVRMHPDNPNYVADWVQWTCLSLNSSGKCNSWEMEPSTFYDGERKARGQLLKITTAKGKTVETNQGVFYFSFKVNLTNP